MCQLQIGLVCIGLLLWITLTVDCIDNADGLQYAADCKWLLLIGNMNNYIWNVSYNRTGWDSYNAHDILCCSYCLGWTAAAILYAMWQLLRYDMIFYAAAAILRGCHAMIWYHDIKHGTMQCKNTLQRYQATVPGYHMQNLWYAILWYAKLIICECNAMQNAIIC